MIPVCYVQDQYDCPGRYANSGAIDINLHADVLHFDILTIDDPNETIIETVKNPQPDNGGIITSELTLSNSAGSTTSELIKIGW